MKIENIELAKQLIHDRTTLNNVLERSEFWKNGHFEFVEHCGDHPNSIRISYFPELEKEMLALIRKELEKIEKQIEEL